MEISFYKLGERTICWIQQNEWKESKIQERRMVNLFIVKHLLIGTFLERRVNVKVVNMVGYKVEHVHYNKRL